MVIITTHENFDIMPIRRASPRDPHAHGKQHVQKRSGHVRHRKVQQTKCAMQAEPMRAAKSACGDRKGPAQTDKAHPHCHQLAGRLSAAARPLDQDLDDGVDGEP